MTKMILVYDDEPTRVSEWRERLQSIPEVHQTFQVQGVDDQEFVRGLNELEARRRSARNMSSKVPKNETAFDAAAVLVIDYDLFRVEHPSYLTGEVVAYLARCYSRCGFIVGINFDQFGENHFDLTLRGHPDSHADLNMGSKQLHNRGLWGEPWKGFRPWQWPLLPIACQALENRVNQIKTQLDTPIVRHLGLPDGLTRTLPRAARDFVANKEAIDRTTFRSFALESGQGFRRKDRPLDEEQVVRVAAARVAQWVESYLLPGQDILVDAPHLAYRYPSLLTGDVGNVEVWNSTASLSDSRASSLRGDVLNQFAFPADWVSRPAWNWSGVSTCESIEEVSDPWSIQRPDWVFCEDLSQFMPLDAVREFVADVESPFARRYVSNPESEQVAKLRNELLQIDYRPQERLYR